MDWKDPKTGETAIGFKEMGFLPEAFINMLALLGWNDGSSDEIFDLIKLASLFSIERIHKGGAKFDFEKAKWFNAEWIKKSSTAHLLPLVKEVLKKQNISATDEKIEELIPMVKERCQLLNDFYVHTSYFFTDPATIDALAVKPKWDETKKSFLSEWIKTLENEIDWNAATIEDSFKKATAEKQIKAGDIQFPLRIMLVGGKFGPPVFEIAAIIGKEATIRRIENGISIIENA
jgi:glutamyl-tRNA synthetase